MTDMASTEMGLTDMGPFFNRHDQRTRLTSVAALSASLVLSAVIATRLLTPGATHARPMAVLWAMGVAFSPLVMVGWWTFVELMALGRRKGSAPDGRYPASADDARNGVRIANAGFAYHLGLMGALMVQQVLMAALVFGYPLPGLWITRGLCVVVGGVTIYLGNLWPRMPTPRTPERTAAIKMRVNRFSGWLMVIVGLLVVLLGVFLPLLHPGPR